MYKGKRIAPSPSPIPIITLDELRAAEFLPFQAGISAGMDLLPCPEDVDAAVDALTRAVEDGTITEERLNESVLRVLQLKFDRGIIPAE